MREDRPLPLTSVDPGQIWLIEHDPSAALAALDRAVLTRANVVLYDRALAALVAQALPIGAYAEPLPATSAAAGPAIAPRALDFASEGWSVVQLVAAGPAWRARAADPAAGAAAGAPQRGYAGPGDRQVRGRPPPRVGCEPGRIRRARSRNRQ